MNPAPAVIVCETPRLRLRQLTLGDAGFIQQLLNDPDWLRYIGDRKVHSAEDARNYIRKGPAASYEKNGFGLWLVERKDGTVPVGICGLIRRDTLPDVDVGFAFLPEFRGQGYAVEAGRASLDYGRKVHGLKRVVAITSPDNVSSIKTLEKLGLRFEKMVRPNPADIELKLFATES
ncbi:MAG: GNAT family N-acetyltransferase [Lacunisphaera sp.]|nr:GNAT family N-acetyltransferase [Lacunisphaera sp.]